MRIKLKNPLLPAVLWAVGFLYWRPPTIPECAFWTLDRVFAFRIVFREKPCASCELAGMPDSDILIIHGEPCDSEQPKEVRM